MAYLTDLAFAIVGLLTIAVYGWLLLVGSLAETALLVALGGGLLLGLLASATLRIVVTASRPTGVAEPGGKASTTGAPTASTAAGGRSGSNPSPRGGSATRPGLETA